MTPEQITKIAAQARAEAVREAEALVDLKAEVVDLIDADYSKKRYLIAVLRLIRRGMLRAATEKLDELKATVLKG